MFRLRLVVVVVAAAMYLSGCCCCEPLFQRNFDRFTCRSKQSEAKSNLKALWSAQMAFRGEHERFGTLDEIGFAPSGETLRYEYVLLEGTGAEHFVAEARGLADMKGDVWQVDEAGVPLALASLCGPVPEQESGGNPIEVMWQEPDATDRLELKRALFEVRY